MTFKLGFNQLIVRVHFQKNVNTPETRATYPHLNSMKNNIKIMDFKLRSEKKHFNTVNIKILKIKEAGGVSAQWH